MAMGVPSHPSRVRELKHLNTLSIEAIGMSHPSRVRELKLRGLHLQRYLSLVAPLPGA